MEKYYEQFRVWLVLKNYAKATRKCYLLAFKITGFDVKTAGKDADFKLTF